MAILAGDGLQAQAFALLAVRHDGDATLAVRQLRTIERIAVAAGPTGMVGGQVIDLEAVTPVPGRAVPPPFDAATLEGMHARKTGAMIRAAAVAGAIMAGGDDVEVDAIDRYAREIGLAFQIVDDILDVEGASDALGKTAGKDAAAGKPTYPALFGMARSRALASECLARAHQALAAGGFTASRLADVAEWVVRRQS
jgi:geranylgeranyl pyrophosphate synthase